MIDQNEAAVYFEPESLVMSRSGEECIVALCDQWYMSYNEVDWKNQIKQHVEDKQNFNPYN